MTGIDLVNAVVALLMRDVKYRTAASPSATLCRCAILHIEHRIGDIDRWLRDFASRAPAREQAGVTDTHVLQAEDDPQYIVELLFFDTADAASNYRTFLREQVWSSSSPGLAGHPHSIILHEVETGDPRP